jgi:preprotein translocase subunit SecF
MFVVKYKGIFLTLGALLTCGGLVLTFLPGIPLGVDFAGGTLIEATYDVRPDKAALLERLPDDMSISLRESGESGYSIRTRTLTPEEVTLVTEALSDEEHIAKIDRATTIGPSLSQELGVKALVAIVVLSLLIMIYIALTFRKVSRPVPSIVYGSIVIITLLHDILIPTGFYAILAQIAGAELDALFVVALLAILGYSINDTIVVLDRVRENLRDVQEKKTAEPFHQTVGKSLQQTYGRSINTSLTVAIALLALFFFGASVTENFALVLLAGVVAGTYSSIFIAAPLLVFFQEQFFKRGR